MWQRERRYRRRAAERYAAPPDSGVRVPTIYKIVPPDLWRAAERDGIFHGSPVDLQDGFIHFSTAAQVAETAGKHFSGQTDLLLVAVDAAILGDALKWEPSRGGALFPHLYAGLDVRLATSVVPLPLGEDGKHRFPPLDP
jgi:uncharacterized protein (DUF952 family)